MKSFRRFFVLVAALSASAVFSANTLSTGGHDGTLRTQSGDVLGMGTVNLGGVLEYSQEWEYLHSVQPYEERYTSPRLLSGQVFLGVGVAPNFDIGLNLPVYYDNPGFGSTRPYGIAEVNGPHPENVAGLGAQRAVMASGAQRVGGKNSGRREHRD
jgi:hypothetical protein